MNAANANIVTINSNTLLDRLNDPGFFSDHLVVAIDLSAIRDRMAERWPRRKEQVWEHFGRSLERRLQDAEVYQRVNETGFIVGLVGESRTAAIAVASHALQDVLHFFLGAALFEDIRLSEVLSMADVELSSRSLGDQEVRDAAASWTDAGSEATDGLVKLSPTVTIQTVSGRALDVMVAVQRIRRLVPDRGAALRAAPHITDRKGGRRLTNHDRRALDFGDIAAIDTAVLSLTRAIWEQEPELGAIMVPISFHTLSRTGARTKLLSQARIIADERVER